MNKLNADAITKLHEKYCGLTGLRVPLTLGRIWNWEQWCLKGYSEADLEVTIQFLQQKIKANRKTISCLKFSNLIGNTEWFDEDLAEARAIARQPRTTPREKILQATGRKEPEKVTCRSAADVLAGIRAFEEFKALRGAL